MENLELDPRRTGFEQFGHLTAIAMRVVDLQRAFGEQALIYPDIRDDGLRGPSIICLDGTVPGERRTISVWEVESVERYEADKFSTIRALEHHLEEVTIWARAEGIDGDVVPGPTFSAANRIQMFSSRRHMVTVASVCKGVELFSTAEDLALRGDVEIALQQAEFSRLYDEVGMRFEAAFGVPFGEEQARMRVQRPAVSYLR